MMEYAFEFEYNDHDLDDLAIQDRNREIRRLLQEHQCEITFRKVNGEVRTMPCTLMSTMLPARELAESAKIRAPKLDTISVYCLDQKEWRSFRVANVLSVRVGASD